MTALIMVRFALVALVTTGCVFVARSETTTRNLGTTESEQTMTIERLVLAARSGPRGVHVQASYAGQCKRSATQITETTTDSGIHLKIVDDPHIALLALVFAPIVLPVSLVISGIISFGEDDGTTQSVTPLGTRSYRCTAIANNVTVELIFPSGAVERVKTGADGTLYLPVPMTEPTTGTVAIRSGMSLTEVRY